MGNFEGSASPTLYFKRSITLSLVLEQLFIQSWTSSGQIVGIKAKLAKKKLLVSFQPYWSLTRSMCGSTTVWVDIGQGGLGTNSVEQSRARILSPERVPNFITLSENCTAGMLFNLS